jgi:ketosteroid isomerase-like protein
MGGEAVQGSGEEPATADGGTAGPDEGDFARFLVRCGDAVAHQVGGNSEPFMALWSREDDVVLLGAFGSHVRGWPRVRAHLLGTSKSLHWATWKAEGIVSHSVGDFGYSAWLERTTGQIGGAPAERTLRVTQVYRREEGRWRVVLRHANVMTVDDERNEALLAQG